MNVCFVLGAHTEVRHWAIVAPPLPLVTEPLLPPLVRIAVRKDMLKALRLAAAPAAAHPVAVGIAALQGARFAPANMLTSLSTDGTGTVRELFTKFDANADEQLQQHEYRAFLEAIGVWGSGAYTEAAWASTWAGECAELETTPGAHAITRAGFGKLYATHRRGMATSDALRTVRERERERARERERERERERAH